MRSQDIFEHQIRSLVNLTQRWHATLTRWLFAFDRWELLAICAGVDGHINDIPNAARGCVP
jgi:hypothetical protein